VSSGTTVERVSAHSALCLNFWLLNVYYALSTSCAHGYCLSGNK
jgi:hypothetical protein